MPTRSGNAVWRGDLKNGNGTLGVQSKLIEGAAYSYPSRFEQGQGTNPEELVAAAHAACFSMSLSNTVAKAGHQPTRVSTEAQVELSTDGGAHIAGITLTCEAEIPGLDEAAFADFAQQAKEGCPISKALASVPITLDAKLVS